MRVASFSEPRQEAQHRLQSFAPYIKQIKIKENYRNSVHCYVVSKRINVVSEIQLAIQKLYTNYNMSDVTTIRVSTELHRIH